MKILMTRIISSKKAFYSMVPVLINMVGEIAGIDITQPAMLVLDAAFAGLVFAQLILDLRWGSNSDATTATP